MKRIIKVNEAQLRNIIKECVMAQTKKMNEAESYGWVVEDNDAHDAYDFACEYFGKETLDDQIVTALDSRELAECLAFIFRMNDFREWENYKNGTEPDDEE